MIGKHFVDIQNRNVRFKFEIERNISIIRGDSATGKTTLISMVNDYQSQGRASGVQLSCDKNCVAMVGLGNNWKYFLAGINDSIVFIDEGEEYVSSVDFAKTIEKTDNYYVIATRNNLCTLPYSVDAIYELKCSGKYGSLKKTYNSMKRIYADKFKIVNKMSDNDVVVSEDDHSGYEFYQAAADSIGIDCITAHGKSNILNTIRTNNDKKLLIVADGAAFGPEISNVYGIAKSKGYTLFLPESFEWLILKSGIIHDVSLADILNEPGDYIDSTEYFSWERFFTALLIKLSSKTVYKYDKKRINSYYTSSVNIKKILQNYFEDFR